MTPPNTLVEVLIQPTHRPRERLWMLPGHYQSLANWFQMGKDRTHVVVGEVRPAGREVRLVVAREHLVYVGVVSPSE